MSHDVHIHLRLPRLSRTAKVVTGLVAVIALSGGIAVAAAPSGDREPRTPPRNPAINSANVVTQAGYVAVAPCRVAYTSKAGGAIISGHRRGFYVGGTANFPGQGGTSGGCKIPIGASAVAVSVTTTGSAVGGYLTVYGTGTPLPNARSTSYGKGQTLTTTVITPVNPTNGQVTVFASGTTQVVLDVTGYYREPIAVSVNANGTIRANSGQVVSVTHTAGNGGYGIHFNTDVTGCAAAAVTDFSYYNAGAQVGGKLAYVNIRDLTKVNQPYADATFSLTVTC